MTLEINNFLVPSGLVWIILTIYALIATIFWLKRIIPRDRLWDKFTLSAIAVMFAVIHSNIRAIQIWGLSAVLWIAIILLIEKKRKNFHSTE